MHISIPVTEDLVDSLGGRYVLYSVYLEGFILFKVRYKDLHSWDEQMHDIFGNRLPTFPPKYYLAMTKSMAEERRVMLEQYLQGVVTDSVVSSSDIFITGVRKLQLKTFKMPSIKMILKIYLPDGTLVKVDSKTSDTAERVLEAALYKLNVSRELMEYFSLFITHKDPDGVFSVVKRVVPFEIPFLTIWNINDESYQIDIRKWYMTPFTDAMLMGCKGAVDLIYAQAVQELEMKWSRPTEHQMKTLKQLIKAEDKIKFLETMQQVEHYSYQKLDPGVTDYLDANSMGTVSVGNNELYCRFQTSDNKTEMISLHIMVGGTMEMMLWIGQTQLLSENPFKEDLSLAEQQENDINHQEFKFSFVDRHVLKWITIRTKQAFLLGTWIKKMLSEQPRPCIKENLEIQDNITSANIYTRKQKKIEVTCKKEPFYSNFRKCESSDLYDDNLETCMIPTLTYSGPNDKDIDRFYRILAHPSAGNNGPGF